MGRHRTRKGRSGGARWGIRALIAIALGGLGAAGIMCRGNQWLEGFGGGGRLASRPAAPSRSQGRPPSTWVGTPRSRVPSKSSQGGARPPAASVHLELGTPARAGGRARAGDDDHLMIKPQYALSYNRSRNVANWVGWELDGSWFGDADRYRGRFIADDNLPSGWYRVTHDDYLGSGFDRGHMVRSEERTRSPEDNKATFLLTNILPQRHDLNAGPWLRLEEYCQELAQKQGRTLHVVAGGIFGGHPNAIGKDVAVPESFFKIVVVLDEGQGAGDVDSKARVIAVIMPNTTGILDEGWGRYRTTVDEIEARAGYDFLTAVPAAVQQEIEARIDDGPESGR